MTETTIDSILHQAVIAHKEGKLEEAERCYRAILQSEPNHPDANHNLGILLTSTGKTDIALPFYRIALEENPKIEQFRLSYIGALLTENELGLSRVILKKGIEIGLSVETLKILGSFFGEKGMNAESLKLSEVAVQLNSKDYESHNNLGASLKNCKRFMEAIASFRLAIALKPDFVEAHYNLGCTLHALGKMEEAESSLKRSIAIDANFVAAHNNLGVLYQELGRLKEAESILAQAIALRGDYADPYNNLGLVLYKQGRLQEAEAFYRQSISIKHDFHEAHNNLGNTLKDLNRLDEAEESYLQAATYNSLKALNNLGLLFTYKKQYAKGREYYQRALTLNPEFVDAKYGLSLLHLALKEYRTGFTLYEARHHPDASNIMAIPPNIKVPRYQGTNLSRDIQQKHLLILPEQGLGDEIMFASVLPDLALLMQNNQTTRITLACDPRLVDLFNRSFEFLTVIPKSEDNKYQNLENDLDYWIFIGSLPQFYRHKIEDFARQSTYLIEDNKLLNMWEHRFKKLSRQINIGISWVGGSQKKNTRSTSLEKLLPILSKANQKANIINLQYGDHKKEMEDFRKNTGIIIYDWDDCDPLKDLNNYSAQIKALDLVISIDSALVEFSGALGTKTYVLLPFDQNWRWAEESNKSYWHPNNMTLFRQTKVGEWDDVIQNVVDVFD